MQRDQTGRRIIITGATSGLGLASAEQLAGRGAEVVLAARNRDRAEAAVKRVRSSVPDAQLEIADLDLADQASVRAFAAEQVRSGRRLDLLINNAGTSMVPNRSWTVDGFELQHATNLLGHFTLTGLLLGRLEASGGRVVWLSSVMALVPRRVDPSLGLQGRYDKSMTYSQSKLACGVIGLELDRRLKAAGSSVTSVVAHPGWSNTSLFAQHEGAIPGALHRLGMPLGSRAEDGARSQLYAATAPQLTGGEYIGPRWVGRGRPWRIRPRKLMSDPDSGHLLWSAAEDFTATTYPLTVERAA